MFADRLIVEEFGNPLSRNPRDPLHQDSVSDGWNHRLVMGERVLQPSAE